MNPIDFSKARFQHLNWKFRIRMFLDGKETLTIAEATDHTQCNLGKWFEAEGRAIYGHLEPMKQFDIKHQQLHRLIREIMTDKQNGNNELAEQRYNEMTIVSDHIIRLLSEAQNLINQQAQNEPIIEM